MTDSHEERARDRRRPEASLRAKLLLALSATLLTLGAVEILLRITDPLGFGEAREREALAGRILGHGERGLVLKPGGRAHYMGHEIVIGSHGMRNPETPVQKPDGTFRILMLGDSVAFGWGVAEQDAYPRVVERMLAAGPLPQGYSRIEVINAGVPGWNLVDSYFFLETKGLRYEPDLVFLTLINNDVPPIDEKGVARAEEPQPERTLLPGWTQSLDLGRLGQAVLDKLLDQQATADFRPDAEFHEGGILHVCGMFGQFQKRLGEVPLVVIDTVGSQGGPGLPGIVSCTREHGIPRIEVFLWSENYVRDYAVSRIDAHPNAAGHLVFAEKIVAWCQERFRE